jgi:lipoprotein NlpD
MPRAPVTSSSVSQENKSATPVTLGANQYLVQKGDTLYSIGRKFGIPFTKLAEFNQLQSPYEIHIGQVLNLKASSTNTANNKPNDTASATDDAEVVTSAIARPELSPSADTAAAPMTAPNSTAPATADAGKNVASDLEAIADADIQWQWPLPGKVSAGFDAQTNKGLNITGNPGQAITAAGAGKVIYSGMDVRGYGKLVIIKHNNNLLSVYAHQGNSLVKEGSFVASGEKLATLPSPTNNKPTMLHFEIRQKGKPVDPATYLPANPAANSNT